MKAVSAHTWTRSLVGLVALLVLLVSGCGTGARNATADETATDDTSTTTAGTATPAVLDFTSETVDGDAFDGSTLAGKPTVFWFWAPWCPTCRAQISGVGELAESYGDQVNVVGVGSLDEQAAIEGFAAEVSPDVTLLADPYGAVWRQLGVTAQSTYVVLDETGAEQASGYLDDGELVALVEDLVG
ncbi:protein disulfide oxidoreductase [Mycobacterium cookii]|uniref:Protein disulfide oxidoreductase n=1 Tax=Nocardioides furvisabuli TaxID=375542 RepID=A0ABN2XGA8_9ACTN|nr:TlpA disulfide reductase family protein [Nocardioides furvisabuli]